MRNIICTNDDNVSITFGEKFSPFLLIGCDGIYSVENNVTFSNRTMSDGSIFTGSNLKMRNIILTIADKDNHQFNRGLLYQLFKPKTLGKFTYKESNGDVITTKEIDYYVESILIDSDKKIRTAEISLMCPNPYFFDEHESQIIMTGWVSEFTFPHTFLDEKESLGFQILEKIKTVHNGSGTDGIGVTITMTAEDDVLNPGIIHVEKNSSVLIGTTNKPLNMLNGDILTITTETNNKNVYLERNGVKTKINEYLDEKTEFFNLKVGDNTIRYFSESGEDNLLVDVAFKYKYLGV